MLRLRAEMPCSCTALTREKCGLSRFHSSNQRRVKITIKLKDTKVQNLIKYISWAIFLYLAYCFILFICQRKIIFPRYLIEPASGVDVKIAGLEKTWVNTNYGKIETWFLPPAPNHTAEPAPAIIFAHGKAELIDF